MIGGSIFAQSSKLKRANKAFEELNYQEAIELYNQILEKDGSSAEAKIHLADSYRKINNTVEAEYWYGQVVLMPQSDPVHKLYYGMMLQTNGKCDLAKEWFVKYVEEVPDDLRGQYLVKACDYEEELMTKNEGIYEIENMPFNTDLDDFSPMFFGEGIVFSSEYRDAGTPIRREAAWTGNPFLELFFVDRTILDKEEFEYEYGESNPFSNRINSKFHDAAVSFNEDETMIYFTRNNFIEGKTGRDDNGAIRLKIFSAESDGAGSAWRTLEGLPFNSDEYSVAHPALSPNGTRLYFSSDMPGGFGGMDLYYTESENGRWSPPINLGPGINTEGHEVFPYVSKDSKLYFASNGHVGLGGLDIYHMDIKENNEFGEIINMGYPINSISDDFGIVIDDSGFFGYFSSGREGGQGDDDIYSFKKTAARVEVFVYDEETKEGIEGATVINDCTGTEYTTNSAGFVWLEQKLETCCNYNASFEDYKENGQEGCSKGLLAGEKVLVEIPLSKPLLFDLAGIILDETTQLPIADATVELIPLDCTNKEPQTLTSKEDGSFFFEIDKDCCYELRASKDGEYLATRSKEQCTKELTKSTSIQQNILLAPVMPVNTMVSTGENHSTISGTHTTGTHTTGTHTTGTHTTGTHTTTSGNTTISSTYPTHTTTHSGTTTRPATTHSNVVTNTTTTPSFNQGRTPGTYLLHIYYDFDQSYIRNDARPELERLLAMMQENPQYVVEIGSHTDSRGSYRYNERLSQRRAEAVVRWLKSKGIESKRLRSKGYGENVNVNNCSNNIPCSEEEHQWNRRTEFRILGYYDANGEYIDIVKSARPTKINVDRCQDCPF